MKTGSLPLLSRDPQGGPEDVFQATIYVLLIHGANLESSVVELVQIDERQRNYLRDSMDCKIPRKFE